VNWRQYHEYYAGTESALLSEIGGQQAAVPSETIPKLIHKAILDMEPSRRGQLLRTYVSEQVARVLGLSAGQLDVEQPLTNLGMDSLMAIELKNRIFSDLGINISMVKFLQGFSVAQASSQLLAQLNDKTSLPADLRLPALTPQQTDENNGIDEDLLANIDELSDEQVNSMLAEIMTKDAATE
jgi:acyl carrier protein